MTTSDGFGGHGPNCKLNCCRYKPLQDSINFYANEASLLFANIEFLETLQMQNPAYRPPHFAQALTDEEVKDKLRTLKLHARKLVAIFRILGRHVVMTKTYFDEAGLRVVEGARDWKKEARDWKAKEHDMINWQCILNDQTREFEWFQKRVSREFQGMEGYGMEKEVKHVKFLPKTEGDRVVSVVGSIEDSALALRRKMERRRTQMPSRVQHIAELRQSFVKMPNAVDSGVDLGVDLATPRL